MSEPVSLQPGDALVVVDVQYDFLPGGSLGVPGADTILPVLRRCLDLFQQHRLPVFATRDWHPPDHCSFQEQGGPWPPHCVQGTRGAEFPPELELPSRAYIVSKGTDRDRDAYSGFQDTELHARLQERGVRRLFVGGLATDYCVKATVLDALERGYGVYVLTDAVRAVDVQPGDGKRALEEMQAAGAQCVSLEGISQEQERQI